jgi:hypothetical protein
MAVDNSIKMTWTVTSGSIHTDRYLESENNTDIHKDELSYITSPYIRRREGEREKNEERTWRISISHVVPLVTPSIASI